MLFWVVLKLIDDDNNSHINSYFVFIAFLGMITLGFNTL